MAGVVLPLEEVSTKSTPSQGGAGKGSLRRSRNRRVRLLLLAVATLLILALGAVENLSGNTDDGDVYGSDAVQYLDIARAIEHRDWHSALNPLWSQGYPALIAVARPAFSAGPGGDWTTVRVVNFTIFTADYLAFLFLLLGLAGDFDDASPESRRRSLLLWTAGLSVFAATQICLGQISRVNPDELVSTLFFLACGLIFRLLYRSQSSPGKPQPRRLSLDLWLGLLLGLVLGVGFLVKAVFLALGCGLLVLLALGLWRAKRRLAPVVVAAALFAVIAASYGVALSRAFGKPTLGEAGSINYAWHVDRLQKWVHWEGGAEPASAAWPSPRIARFAQWTAHPPDFGKPLHPSAILQPSPLVYGFVAPFHATYAPYYNPPYWYEGYRRVVRPRFEIIAVVKSLGDLARALALQPIVYAVLFALVLLLREEDARRRFRQWLRRYWGLWTCGVLCVAIYIPVHLEGRYIAGFLALLLLSACAGALQSAAPLGRHRFRWISALLVLGLAADLAAYQLPVWRNLVHHKSPRNNVEWKIGEAVLAQHLPLGAQVGVIAWTANLHCDWAYIAHLQITSEIASGHDFDLFWRLTPAEQLATLDTFRKTGAAAVFASGKPPGAGGAGWKQLGSTPMWMYRF